MPDQRVAGAPACSTFRAREMQSCDTFLILNIHGYSCGDQQTAGFCMPILRGEVQRCHVVNGRLLHPNTRSADQSSHRFLHDLQLLPPM